MQIIPSQSSSPRLGFSLKEPAVIEKDVKRLARLLD